jgi:hypothetical protein
MEAARYFRLLKKEPGQTGQKANNNKANNGQGSGDVLRMTANVVRLG